MLDVVGIDVSKKKIDVCIYGYRTIKSFANEPEGFSDMLQWAKGVTTNDVVFCFENTGYYSLSLAVFLQENGLLFSMITPIEIKRSIGLVRGKSDIIDAYQIARYAWLRKDELKQTVLPGKDILSLSQLLKLRDQFVKQRGALQNMLAAFEQVKSLCDKKAIALLKVQIRQISNQEKKIEAEIKKLLVNDDFIKNYELLRSIKGIGLIVAAQFIAHTNNFQSFERWRQFACYCGIAPFEHQSGSSIKGKTKVNSIADKKLKSLLTMAAISAVQSDIQLRAYYKRKVNTGKSKMSVLNAIKCKLVARAFAVVNRQTPYVQLLAA